MNLELWEQNDVTQTLWSWAQGILIDCGVKGVLILLLAAGVTALMRRASASARHLVWALALGALLLLPVASLLFPALQLPVLLPQNNSVQTVSGSQPVTPRVEKVPTSVSSPSAPAFHVSDSKPVFSKPAVLHSAPLPFSAWVIIAWASITLALLLPLVAGFAVVSRLVRNARPFEGDDWEKRVRSLVDASGLRRTVRVLCGGPEAMPMATGLVRSTILLPAEANDWPEEKLRAVLLHELAHVKRWDCLTHALARVAAALHWFNPLAWIAMRNLRIERERACDDLVLIAGERASSYADHLLNIASTMQSGTLAAAAAIPMAKKSQLEGRLLAILDVARNRRGVRWGAIIVGVILLLVITVPLGMLKFAEARVFSDMTPEEKAYFQRWYTEKVVVPPGALDVKEYAPDSMKAVDECHAQYDTLKDKIDSLAKEYAGAFPSNKSETAISDDLEKRWGARFNELEPFLVAYQTAARQPDYDNEVWRPMPGKWKPSEKNGSPINGVNACVQLRVMAHLTAMQAQMELEKKNYSRAMACADTIVLSSRAHRYSTLIDRMVAVAVLRIGAQTWQRIVDKIQDKPELLFVAQEKINAHNLDEYNLTFSVDDSMYTGDYWGILRHAKRWGIEPNVQDKTGFLLGLEGSRAMLEVDKKYTNSNAKGMSKPELDMQLRNVNNEINNFTGNVWFGKRLLMRWTGPVIAATLYGIATPGFQKAQQHTQQTIQQYRDLQKSLAEKQGKAESAK